MANAAICRTSGSASDCSIVVRAGIASGSCTRPTARADRRRTRASGSPAASAGRRRRRAAGARLRAAGSTASSARTTVGGGVGVTTGAAFGPQLTTATGTDANQGRRSADDRLFIGSGAATSPYRPALSQYSHRCRVPGALQSSRPARYQSPARSGRAGSSACWRRCRRAG